MRAAAPAPEQERTEDAGSLYDSVRADLVAIAVRWLGEADAASVVDCLLRTEPGVEHYLTTINTIRQMTIPGQEGGTLLAMAREMQVFAAERLCGL